MDDVTKELIRLKPEAIIPIKTRMFKCLVLAGMLSLVAGCGAAMHRMAQPEDPHGRYREQIAAAQRLLDQKESWSDRVEWEIVKSSEGWKAIAWRIEYPEAKGPNRYLPWGYSVIELDSRMVAVSYQRKG